MDREKYLEELESKIIWHKNLYYNGKAEISDEEFDRLEDELRKLSPDSYVLNIVGPTFFHGEKIPHENRMLSLRKTYKIDELIQWKGKEEIISTFKIDGSSCSLIYRDGALVMAKTRGDGQFGENITSKAFYINDIPKVINKKNSYEVRGEIFCQEEDFIHLAEEMAQKGLERPNSQRNIVAGILGRKENIELARYLSFQAFELFADEQIIESEEEKFKYLRDIGFKTPEFYINKTKSNLEERVEEARVFMSEGDYLIDGLVFSYNDLKLHDQLGSTAHHPRYKIAYKFQGDVKETEIKEIRWQVSRNGILTPVAIVEEVYLSGANVSRVTLHNFGLVQQFELKAGDRIEIVRSGEVIPKFIRVVVESDNSFKYPASCPGCGERTYVDDIRLLCKNPCCKGKIKDEILNYIRKIGIENLSDRRLDDLISLKKVNDIPSLYRLKEEDLLDVDKIKEKLATKILSSVEKSKSVELVVFLSSLGISGGAYNKCEKIISHGFDSLDKIMSLNVKDLENIEGFATRSSEEFYNSLQEKKELVRELLELGISVKTNVVSKVNNPNVSGLKFCVTGTLGMKRSEIKKLVLGHGGLFVSSVTSTTDYLICNDIESGSSKVQNAKKFGTKIIDEEKFKELIKSHEKE